jgi:hypothetical protein
MHIPYESMQVLAKLYTDVEILHRNDLDTGIELSVSIPGDKLDSFTARYAQYIASSISLLDQTQE